MKNILNYWSVINIKNVKCKCGYKSWTPLMIPNVESEIFVWQNGAPDGSARDETRHQGKEHCQEAHHQESN
jgi:hypothetical protein